MSDLVVVEDEVRLDELSHRVNDEQQDLNIDEPGVGINDGDTDDTAFDDPDLERAIIKIDTVE